MITIIYISPPPSFPSLSFPDFMAVTHLHYCCEVAPREQEHLWHTELRQNI